LDGTEIANGWNPLDPNNPNPQTTWQTWKTLVIVGSIIILLLGIFTIIRNRRSKSSQSSSRSRPAPPPLPPPKPELDQITTQKSLPIKHPQDSELVKKRVEMMKKIIGRYNRIKIDRLMDVLEFDDTKELDIWLISLPKELEFFVDGDEVVIPRSKLLVNDQYNQQAMQKIEQSFKHLSKTCFYCGFPIERDTKICPGCAKTIKYCAVCKLPISFGEQAGKCSLCETWSHLDHMQEWIKVNGTCPSCLQRLPVEGIVPIQTDYQGKKK
jgi:hypothetical protein